ncbi:MAG: alpha/beta fold hydrolase [Pseudomonadota bacterium]
MTRVMRVLAAAAAAGCLLAAQIGVEAVAAPPSIEDMLNPTVSLVSLSPSGRYVAIAKNAPRLTERMRRSRGEEKSAILILDLQTGKPLANVATETRAISLDWASDDDIVANLTKGETIRAGGRAFRNIGLVRTLRISRDGGEVFEIFAKTRADDFGANAQIIEPLPDEPEYMIFNADLRAGSGVYKVNIMTGDYETIYRGREGDGYVLNSALQPVFRVNQNNRGNVVRWYGSADGGSSWYKITEFVTVGSGNQPPPFLPVGPTPDPDRMLVIAPQRGDGPTGVYEFDVKERTYTRTVFEHPRADIDNYISDSMEGERQRVIVQDRKQETYYLDPQDRALQKDLEAYFGEHVTVSLAQWTRDDSKALIYVEGPTVPGEYHLLDASKGSIALLFRTHDDVPDDALGEVEILEARMSDGKQIFSYVTHPVGSKTKKAPLIVMPHGGPQARDNFEFGPFPFPQVFASRGYRVIQPQFRGGGGYGWEFAKEGHGEYGDRIQKDVFESVQVLIDRGLADPKNVCTWGWSHGGYVAAAATFLNADVVACAVAGASGDLDLIEGVNQERDDFGASSTPYLYWKDAKGDPQTDYERMAAVSPARNADKIDVPLMLLHGEDDTTVPVEQSRIMRRAMRRAGKEDLLVYKEYKDEGHTLTRANWIDAMERSLEFYEKHLRR